MYIFCSSPWKVLVPCRKVPGRTLGENREGRPNSGDPLGQRRGVGAERLEEVEPHLWVLAVRAGALGGMLSTGAGGLPAALGGRGRTEELQ